MTLVSPTSLIRGALNNRADMALCALETRTCHSWKMGLDRAQVLPPTEDVAGHPAVHLFMRESNGATITDVDGNTFIDLSMGFGAQLLGHGNAAIKNAVMAQAAHGWDFGLVNERQLELARHVQAAGVANQRVVFCNSGDDAVAYAMRAARAFTGRDMVGLFAGSSHGTHDGGAAHQQSHRPRAFENGLFARPWVRRSPTHTGIPQVVSDTAIVLSYGHTATFAQIQRRRRELAAVIVEPVRASDPNLDHIGWLRELANVCGETGVLLILDERLSGFRLAYGGAQERFGIMPDLVTYGENIGGGLPLGAVAGRSDTLESLAFNRAHPQAAAERSFSGNVLSIAAGAATLETLIAQKTTLYPALEDMGRTLAQGFNSFAVNKRIPAVLHHAGSMFRIHFGPPHGAAPQPSLAAESAFYALMLSKGVLMHASRTGFLSAAHTTNDIELVLRALYESLADVQNDGLFDRHA